MEPLTPAQVTDVLRAHVDPDATCRSAIRGPIGNGQETWFLDVESPSGPTNLVLRRTAEAGPLELTNRTTEAAVMRAVAAVGVAVPTVHAVVGDPTVLGAPFMVMDRVVGSSVVQATPSHREALSVDLMAHLWRLHHAGVADPQGRDAAAATRDEIHRWQRHYVTNRIAPVPLVDALLAWCTAAVPTALAAVPAVLLWGDAGAHNALGQEGHITGLLDWELAHHGHPLEDLAAAIWIEGPDGLTQADFVAAYETASETSVDLEVLQYFLALTCVTRSVMILVGAAAFVNGRTSSPTLAGLGLDLPALHLGAAATHAGWGAVPQDADMRSAQEPEHAIRPTGAEITEGVARFLRDDVLTQIDTPRTRREIKTAVALLDTAAHRSRTEPAVEDVRRQAEASLLDELAASGVVGDLATVAARIEAQESLAAHRPRVRAHLLADLARTRTLLTPLRSLYHR